MTQNEGDTLTPRQFDYWELTYRELAITPQWSELDAEARAQKLLERIEAKLSEADSPPQLKALFDCAREERLKTVRTMIERFADAGGS